MNNRPQHNPPQQSHTEAALADYLQDLLLPQEEASPAAQRQQWAEPPALDPRVFSVAPPLSPPERIAEQAVAEPRLVTPSVQEAPTIAQAPPVEHTARPEPDPIPENPPITEAPVANAPIASEPLAAPEIVPEKALETASEVRQNRWVDGRPEWAQVPFDCLLFSVGVLKLAVPLVLLGAVHPLEGELTPLFGRPKWFMGLLKRSDRNVRVVDTAQWVMPDRYRSDAQATYGFVIRLDNSEWGLACDEVAQSFRLKPDQVKWRSEDSRRPWLAGTVKSQMCALLDVGRFARMLQQAEKTQKLDLET